MDWLATLDRLATGDKVRKWNIQMSTLCVLCDAQVETRDYLFFSVSTPKHGRGCPRDCFTLTTQSNVLISCNFFTSLGTVPSYTVCCLAGTQSKEAQKSPDTSCTFQVVDKCILNRLSSFCGFIGYAHEGGLSKWFATN